jgi:glucose-1-phosphate adenylyltransferase
VFADEGRCMGFALDSLISHGCIISGGRVTRSVLSPGVRVDCQASVESSILFSGVQVGARSKIKNAIVDHNVRIPENTMIGLDPEANRRAGHTVTESGLVVVHAGSPGVRIGGAAWERRRPLLKDTPPQRYAQSA